MVFASKQDRQIFWTVDAVAEVLALTTAERREVRDHGLGFNRWAAGYRDRAAWYGFRCDDAPRIWSAACRWWRLRRRKPGGPFVGSVRSLVEDRQLII